MNNRLKEYRARYNYTQEKLATLIGVTRPTISFIEKNKMLPSVLLALKCARVFNCNVEDLFQLEEQGSDEDE